MTDPLIVTVTQEVVGVSTSVDTIKVDMGVQGPQGIQGPAGDLDATIFDAKGDLIGASAADTAVRVPVGTNGQVLQANSSATAGIEWTTTGDATLLSSVATGGSGTSGDPWTGWETPVNNATAGTNYLADIGYFAYGSNVTIKQAVNLLGSAAGGTAGVLYGTNFVATAAASQLNFEGRGGESGNFNVDGDNVATEPIRFGLGCVSRKFRPIRVTRGAAGGSAALFEHSQNCVFELLDVVDCDGDGIVLDTGTGGHTVFASHTSNIAGWALNITETSGTGPYGWTGPSDNDFYNPIFERLAAGSPGLVRHAAGKNNKLFSPNMATGSESQTATVYCFHGTLDSGSVTASECLIIGPQFSGEGTWARGLRTDSGATVTVLGTISAVNLAAMLELNGGLVNWDAYYVTTSGTTWAVGTGSENSILRNRTRGAPEVARPGLGDAVFRTFVDGETVQRFRIQANGTLNWGDGTGSEDTDLRRWSANLLRTQDKFAANLGIGVGNSVAATTPGSVTRKMEVFDAAGASIGFVAIYDAIT